MEAGTDGGPVIRVAVATLGCKVNQCESAGMAELLTARGMALVPFDQEADCYIVNTCTVTGRTDYQSRQLIRRAIRRNPAAAILVTGCYAQRAPEEIARIAGVGLVAGNAEKASLPALIAEMTAGPPRLRVGDIRRETAISPLGATVFPEHTRAFLKIQDGCNSACTYCIVPSVRGTSRSLAPTEVAGRIAALAEAGYREAVLTGIHLGTYGRDLEPACDLTSLIAGLVDKAPIGRIRLSSIEPREVTDGLVGLMASPGVLCRHLHIPLQSGDDGVLAAMGRNYDAAFFRDLIRNIHAAVPGIAIGVDVLAGFPGESEEAFSNTMALLDALPVAYLHVFPYSRRPGTPAAAMAGQVPEGEKKRRAELLRAMGTAKRGAFASRFIGTPLEVLVEGKGERATGLATGFSDNYIPIAVQGPAEANRVVRVIPASYRNGRLFAEVIHG